MKRLFDMAMAFLALVILSPLLLMIALLVALTSPGGAFFRQIRVGRNGREFHLFKFRSMRPGSEAKGQLTVGGSDPRVTGIGRFLRRTNLDELPQLWNVLAGDMSLVGPRPEVPRYVALYSEEQRKVLRVRPGLTGPASLAYVNENEILGRAADPEKAYVDEVMPAKLALDLAYVQEHSFFGDLALIFRTIGKIFG